MITRQELIDAARSLLVDYAEGTILIQDVDECPAIAALLERLPAEVEPGTTRPLHAPAVEPADLERYVGYRFCAYVFTGNANHIQWMTIGAVRRDGENHLIEPVEYPGFHLIRRAAPTDLWADVTPPTACLPDLIDRSSDIWRWYGGYGLNDPGLWSRAQVDEQYGPVRDA